MVNGLKLTRYVPRLVTKSILINFDYKLRMMNHSKSIHLLTITSYTDTYCRLHLIEYITTNTSYTDTYYRLHLMRIHLVDHILSITSYANISYRTYHIRIHHIQIHYIQIHIIEYILSDTSCRSHLIDYILSTTSERFSGALLNITTPAVDRVYGT